ncbi:hypothetical protein ACFX2I_007794 [Malus domestica]
MNLPAGYRFCPTDEELIMYYLQPKVNGKEVPGQGNSPVFDFDLYGVMEPWDIWEKFKTKRENDLKLSNDLYCFTTLKLKTTEGTRICRTLRSGSKWNGENRPSEIKNSGSEDVIGHKKRFSYSKNGSDDQQDRWIMYEFDIDQKLVLEPKQENKIVLCMLRKKVNGSEKKRKHGDLEEEEMLGDNNMDISNGDSNYGDLDRKQVVPLETQEKQQCFLPSNAGYLIPQVQRPEVYDPLQKFHPQSIVYNVVHPQTPLQLEQVDFHGKRNWGLQHLHQGEETWKHKLLKTFISKNIQGRASGSEQKALQGEESREYQSFMSCVDNVQALGADPEQSALPKEVNWRKQCSMPCLDSALHQAGENHQVQQSSQDNVANGSLINNNIPHCTKPVPPYGLTIDQVDHAGSGNVYGGFGAANNDDFAYTPWIKSFANELLRTNCSSKFN